MYRNKVPFNRILFGMTRFVHGLLNPSLQLPAIHSPRPLLASQGHTIETDNTSSVAKDSNHSFGGGAKINPSDTQTQM